MVRVKNVNYPQYLMSKLQCHQSDFNFEDMGGVQVQLQPLVLSGRTPGLRLLESYAESSQKPLARPKLTPQQASPEERRNLDQDLSLV